MTLPTDESGLAALIASASDAEAVHAANRDWDKRGTSVLQLRELHEDAARIAMRADAGALVPQVRAALARGISASDAARGIIYLAQAEAFQWEIGTWASGAGGGRASMRSVRELQLARALVLSVIAPHDPPAREQAMALADQVEHDPNNSAADLAADVTWLRAQLAR